MYDSERDSERECLMRQLQCQFFALDDIRLYLDTHPCDQTALDYYEKFRKLKDKTLEEYTCKFGPINSYNIDVDNCWPWVQTPWPWERQV